MSSGPRYSDYDRFAWVYNRHWGDKFIPMVMPILETLVLQYLPDKARILDLCCGTGQLAQVLIARGYRVTGIDGSEEMLRFARENAPTGRFVMADARSFKLSTAQHAVLSTFDSLNHIMSLEDLISVFRQVYAVLREGGRFLFDLNMEQGYKVCWEDNYGIVEDDHACIVRMSYHPDERTARFDATIFRWQDEWQRSDVTLRQKCYSETEVKSALATAGFVDIKACTYDELWNLAEITGEVERAFFVCRKPLPG